MGDEGLRLATTQEGLYSHVRPDHQCHASKQRNTDDERQAIKDGKSAQDIWPDDPVKAAQNDVDARWTLLTGGKVHYKDAKPLPMIALPVFGYKIDRCYGFIRAGEVTSAADADGRMLRHVIAENSSSEVWTDTACRSRTNETWLADRIHRCKANGKSIPRATDRVNAAKSAIRAKVEHVFAHQKNRLGLFIRTIGLKRTKAKLTLANLA